MLKRSTKDLFYTLAGPLMRLNAYLYRSIYPSKGNGLMVHLGPGQKNYLKGWVNVDANMFTGECDIWADLKNRLPFRDGTVMACYSHHVVEHLPNIMAHFNEVYRCLQVGGVYRIAVPNGDSAMKKYQEGDLSWFGVFPDNRSSIGGRLDNFILCRNEHLHILTPSYLLELLGSAGFHVIKESRPVSHTNYPEYFQDCLPMEWESDTATPHTLVMEAVKS